MSDFLISSSSDLSELKIKAQLALHLREKEKNESTSYQTNLQKWRTDPFSYAVERLGVKREALDWGSIPDYENHKWDGTPNPMMQILDAVKEGKWVGVESGTGVGKTFLGACLALWFWECFPNALVVTSAPKEKQLELHIWKEIGKVYHRINRGRLHPLKLRMHEGKDDWIIVGFVAGTKAEEDSSTKAQGFHAEHMLIILEETPGINSAVIEAFQNTAGGGHNIIIGFGNPDHQHDNLHRFCLQNTVKHIRISGYDHPNVVLNNPDFIPGAQSWNGLRRLEGKGLNNPLYLSRAKGISPAQSSDALIRMEWISDANQEFENYCNERGKFVKETVKGIKGLGVDVANSEDGDKASIVAFINNVFYEVEEYTCPDSNEFGKKIIARKMKGEGIKPEFVGVDGIGVGAGTVNALKEMKLRVKSLIGSEKAIPVKGKEEQFFNLRSQMWWELREDLSNGDIALIHDDDLNADLTTPVWSIVNGKIKIEGKDDIKKRLGRSPNKGDALVYANWMRKRRSKSAIGTSTVC